MSACSTGDTTTSQPATSSPAPTDCPTAPATMPGGGAPPAGGGAISIAKTVAPSDTSTSTVIDGTGAQIQCGRVQLATHNDVLYDTPTSAGKSVPLKVDVQVPQTPGPKPLVVYITGGGFMIDDKSANLNQRTYVAEQGFVVASIEYRTIGNGATYPDAIADVKSAIRFLRAHAGASDLSAIAADFDTATQDSLYAPGNFLAQFVLGPGSKQSIKDNPQAVAAANPITYLSTSTPPFAILHGTADQFISPSQTLALHNAIVAKGGKSIRYAVEGANHGDLTVASDPKAAAKWSSEQIMGKIVAFLHENLG